jgi:serine/threonine-protein kinase/endoribonuclease IRE1
MKIIHRDIKPQNVLVSKAKDGSLRMLVSDFGLARRLEQGQSSFAPTANNLAGSLGWRAPECIRGQVKLNDGFDPVLSCCSSGSTASSTGSLVDLVVDVDADGKKIPSSRARLTKAVDLFALGCLYFWVLMNGEHPFGETYNRESNIVKGDAVNMDKLSILGEEGVEAMDLIGQLLSLEPSDRPETHDCLIHPYFWTPAKRLAFLCDASDRFEIMEAEPPETTLVMLETNAQAVVGKDWYSRMDRVFTSSLGKFRKYKGNTVRDLLRAMRNKKHHYQDLEPSAQRHFGSLPAGFLNYFTSRFPRLFLHVHGVVKNSRLRHEPMFDGYFQES